VFVGCVRKQEQSKKSVSKELFSEIGVFDRFSCEERVVYEITGSKDMGRKGHQKFWA